jgi:hypothetical protein
VRYNSPFMTSLPSYSTLCNLFQWKSVWKRAWFRNVSSVFHNHPCSEILPHWVSRRLGLCFPLCDGVYVTSTSLFATRPTFTSALELYDVGDRTNNDYLAVGWMMKWLCGLRLKTSPPSVSRVSRRNRSLKVSKTYWLSWPVTRITLPFWWNDC